MRPERRTKQIWHVREGKYRQVRMNWIEKEENNNNNNKKKVGGVLGVRALGRPFVLRTDADGLRLGPHLFSRPDAHTRAPFYWSAAKNNAQLAAGLHQAGVAALATLKIAKRMDNCINTPKKNYLNFNEFIVHVCVGVNYSIRGKKNY